MLKSQSQSLLRKASAALPLSSHPSTPSLAFQSYIPVTLPALLCPYLCSAQPGFNAAAAAEGKKKKKANSVLASYFPPPLFFKLGPL